MSPVTWVTPDWVREHLADPDFILLDPRRPMKYMSGHLPGAVNLPVYTAFDEESRLMDPDPLARWAADAGLTNNRTPLLYDSVDGQTGAMLSWVLQYLGCPEVLLMDTFFEGWSKAGGEVFYRPVPPTPAEFSPTPNESIRARWEDVSQASNASLIDFRSRLEYSGQDGEEGAGGHVPGAKHLEWRSLVGENNVLLRPRRHPYLDASASSCRLRRSRRLLPHRAPGLPWIPRPLQARLHPQALRRLNHRLAPPQRPPGNLLNLPPRP